MASLKNKVQNALDEARLLILGSQVLIGFHFRSVFENGFDRVPKEGKELELAALYLLLITLALLIAPGSYHRLAARGNDTREMHSFTSAIMDFALLPLALAIAIDMLMVARKIGGPALSIVTVCAAAGAALGFWYGISFVHRLRHGSPNEESEPQSGFGGRGPSSDRHKDKSPHHTKLSNKIRHVLTEGRVVLPGAQALLGFQFVTVLMDSFERLPVSSKYVHFISLCLIALTVILLMAPAAYHRLAIRGEETQSFYELASRFVLAAMVTLAPGICLELFVVVRIVSDSVRASVMFAIAFLLIFYGLWFGLSIFLRHRRRSQELESGEVKGPQAAARKTTRIQA